MSMIQNFLAILGLGPVTRAIKAELKQRARIAEEDFLKGQEEIWLNAATSEKALLKIIIAKALKG